MLLQQSPVVVPAGPGEVLEVKLTGKTNRWTRSRGCNRYSWLYPFNELAVNVISDVGQLQLRSLLRDALLAGDASSDEVARRLSITHRTLHRRLKIFDATYEALFDETRFDLARQLLKNSRASMIDIAAALNYNNASAFTRAFRRRTGMTPSEWRLARIGAET
jgi:AraC-like DNA-binding protein